MELDILCSLIHDNVSYVMAAQQSGQHHMTPVRAPEVKEAAATTVETERTGVLLL